MNLSGILAPPPSLSLSRSLSLSLSLSLLIYLSSLHPSVCPCLSVRLRIRRLYSLKTWPPPKKKRCPWYDTELYLIIRLQFQRSWQCKVLLPGPLRFGAVVRVRVLSIRFKILWVWERQGQRNGEKLVEDRHIGLSLTLAVIPHSGPYASTSLMRDYQPGSAVDFLPRRLWRPIQLLSWLGCISNWLTVTLWLTVDICVYIWFYDTHAFRLWFTWSASASQPTEAVFLFTQPEHPIPEIPDWQLGQRLICNNKTV